MPTVRPDASPPQTLVVERCKLLLHTMPVSALTNGVVAAIAVALLGPVLPDGGMQLWGAVMLGLQVLRLLLWLIWRRRPIASLSEAQQNRKLLQLRVYAWLTAATWGALPITLFPTEALSQSYLAFILAGISGAAVAGLSFDAWTSAVFVLAVVVPLILRLFLVGTSSTLTLGLLVCVYLIYLMSAVRRSQSQFLQMLDWRSSAEAAGASAQLQARRNAALARANQLGTSADDQNAFFEALCVAAVEQTGVDSIAILRLNAQDEFVVIAQAGAPRPTGIDATARLAWQSGAAQFVQEGPRQHGLLPLRRHGERVALLQASGSTTSQGDTALQDWLSSLAASIDRGLQALWQRERIDRLQKLYRALIREGEVVLQSRSAEDMLQHTCDTLTSDTPFHAAWLARPDDSGAFRVLARAGSGAEQLDHFRVHLDDANRTPLVLRVWDSRALQVCNDLLHDRAMQPWHATLARYRWHAALATPVLRDGELWGVLVFTSPQAQIFDDQTIALCEQVSALLGHGLDELDLKDRLGHLQRIEAHRARHDTLTGLPNRYALEQHLPEVIARARRQGSVFALGMIDLDGFKRINDTWGHSAGDRVLRELTRRLQAVQRQTDFLVRLGGDEFIVVMEDLNPLEIQTGFANSMRRLRQAVADPFDIAPNVQLPMEMSIGISAYPLDAQDTDSLMRLADKAMYAAKARNQAATD